jgi:hypothetical protein
MPESPDPQSAIQQFPVGTELTVQMKDGNRRKATVQEAVGGELMLEPSDGPGIDYGEVQAILVEDADDGSQ